MDIEIGSIVEGKITGITRYGAFVSLDDKAVGMVHISEVSWQFVEDLSKTLQIGQSVTVKVLKIDENGRYSLSIKKAQPQPQRRPVKEQPYQYKPSAAVKNPVADTEQSFEDKLKKFMQSSDSRISDLKHNQDRKTGSRREKR